MLWNGEIIENLLTRYYRLCAVILIWQSLKRFYCFIRERQEEKRKKTFIIFLKWKRTNPECGEDAEDSVRERSLMEGKSTRYVAGWDSKTRNFC